MSLKEIIEVLQNLEQIVFHLPNGKLVPKHFHITELGVVSKHFIDCGGTERREEKINFQLWEDNDFDHRLTPEKLLGIISKSKSVLNINEDLDIQVEYQEDSVCLYHLSVRDNEFYLENTFTDCLALETCGINQSTKTKVNLTDLGRKSVENSCTPGSNCC